MRGWWAAALALAGWSSGATAAWQQASSRHFIVYSEDKPDVVADFATRLERFDKAMRVLRGMDDPPFSPSQRVVVFVVRDIGALQKLAKEDNVAGFYLPRVSGPVAFVPRDTNDDGRFALTPQAVLLHEYAHHFMFSAWGSQPFPAWFVEGFAEFNATTVFQPDRLIIGPPPLYRAEGMINDDIVPARDLLTQSPNSGKMFGVRVQVFYGRSWLLTHYLLLDKERRKLMSAYLTALEKGTPLKDAAALLGDPRKLDLALTAYSRTRLPLLGLKISDLPIGPVTVRPLTPGEEAVMPVVLRSTRGVDRKSAQGVATAARKIAVAWPNDPAVQVALAEAEYDAGQYAAADAAAVRALAADPALRKGLMYRGLAQVGLLREGKVTDPKRWEEARGWFVKANRRDPEDPWPLVSFYHAARASGAPMPPNAEKGLSYAYTLAPFDASLAMEVAIMHLRAKRLTEAEPALRRVAFDPHGGGVAAAAGTLLAAIEAGNTAALEKATTGAQAPDEAD